MATLVLVHGAMHGGWCWSRLTPRLAADGHRVEVVTLTGLGERSHLLTPDVGLATHVDDVLGVLRFRDLRDVVLVPHSYGGVVADVVAERSDRVAGIVRLDAFVVRDGECLLDVEPPATVDFYRRWAADRGDGWRLPPDDAFLAQWGITDDDTRAFVGPRLTDFPLRATTDPAVLPTGRGAALTRGAIWNVAPALGGLATSTARAAAAGWPSVEVAAGHDAMVSHPHEVAAAIGALLGG